MQLTARSWGVFSSHHSGGFQPTRTRIIWFVQSQWTIEPQERSLMIFSGYILAVVHWCSHFCSQRHAWKITFVQISSKWHGISSNSEVTPPVLAVCIFSLGSKLETLTCCIIEPKTFLFEFECLVFCAAALKKIGAIDKRVTAWKVTWKNLLLFSFLVGGGDKNSTRDLNDISTGNFGHAGAKKIWQWSFPETRRVLLPHMCCKNHLRVCSNAEF